MRIRPATTEDAVGVARLLAELGYPSSAEEVAARIAELGDGDAVLIAEGALIAMHRVPRLAEGGAFARITALVVTERCRGRGVGTALLAAAEDVARRWGCDELEVSSSLRPDREAAHGFYPAAGFADAAPHATRYRRRVFPHSPDG